MSEHRMHNIKHIHFIGIGGTGMNGIAEVLLNLGYQVSGSDMKKNPATERLQNAGATIFIGHQGENVTSADVVVTSTAVTDDNPEVMAAREKKIPIIPRAQMLAELMRFRFGIAVAGTHGKTTTTSLVASILAEGHLDPTYVIGGRLNSSGSNAKLGTGKYIVAEADESDASFLFLQPSMAIVTNIDMDHMQTYDGDVNKLYDTFIQFLQHLPFYGLAVMCSDDAGVKKVLAKIGRPIITYGFNKKADFQAVNVRQKGLQTFFTVKRKKGDDLDVCINLPGKHNVQNALAAIIVALELGVADKDIINSLQKFAGVGRRCQVLGEFQQTFGKITLIDDYGHHPREVAATQEAIKSAYPTRRLLTVFQPHRFTRTQELFDDFVEVLSDCEKLVMLNVYTAGEKNIPGADSRSLCRSIRQLGKVDPILVSDNEKLYQTLQDIIEDGDVILMQGAGDIGGLAQEMCQALADTQIRVISS